MPLPDPTTHCPVCTLPYVPQGMRCRVSTYDKEGKRREECLPCGAKREREELSTSKQLDENKKGV